LQTWSIQADKNREVDEQFIERKGGHVFSLGVQSFQSWRGAGLEHILRDLRRKGTPESELTKTAGEYRRS